MKEEKKEQGRNDQSKKAGKNSTSNFHSISGGRSIETDMDEKSSTTGRSANAKGKGIASKDGVTGSDYDGQVSSE